MKTDRMLHLFDILFINRKVLHITQIDSIVGMSRRSSYRYIAALREYIYRYYKDRYIIVSDTGYYFLIEV